MTLAHGNTSMFIEVMDGIQTVDIFLRGMDQPTQVTIMPRSITTLDISTDPQESCLYQLPVAINCQTVHSVSKHKGEGVALKARLADNPSSGAITNRMSRVIKRYGTEICYLEHGPSQCGCRMCGLSFFLPDVKFSRVLPLPSKNWNDMSSSWNCCAHSSCDSTKSKKKSNAINLAKKLQPREGDCLIGDIYVVVHTKVIDKNNTFFKKKISKNQDTPKLLNWELRCRRCRYVVGESDHKPGDKVSSYKLYKSCVEIVTATSKTISSSADTVLRPIFYSEFFLERIVAQQFATSAESHVTHMIIIQDYDKNVHLMIKVLNHSTSVYMTTSNHESIMDVPDENGDDYRLNGSDEDDEGTQARYTNSQLIHKLFGYSNHYYSVAREQHEATRSFSDGSACEKVVKVLYACTGKQFENTLFAKWKDDNRPLNMTYPNEMCLQLSLILLANTMTMPVATRVLDGFAVSYLRSE